LKKPIKAGDNEKIVITGLGVVSSIGIGREAFWKALKNGDSGIKPVSLFDTTQVKSKLAGEIKDFAPEEILGPKGLRNLDRTTRLVLCGAKLALEDASFNVTDENQSDVGVVLGSTMGSIWSISEFDKIALREGQKGVNPAEFQNTVINSPASQISIRFGIRGFNTTISSGFSSSLDAFGYAVNFLKAGRAKAILAGGVEELCEQTFKGFYKLGFLSASRNGKEEISAPFDKQRNGAISGEGSCIFILETLEDAKNRGARILANVEGFGSSFDSKNYRKYDLKGESLARAIGRALITSGIKSEDIDYVASSANSTLDGDVSEYRAIIKALGATNIPVSASKSMIGETFSASGAFQAAAATFSLTENILPPTINFKTPDRRCPVNCIPNKAEGRAVRNVLITVASPTGQNSAMILSKGERQ